MKPKTVPQPFKPKPGAYQFVSFLTTPPESSTASSRTQCPTCNTDSEQQGTDDGDKVVFRD